MAPLKCFQKVETAVLESAHNNGLKEVEENEVKKIVKKISEQQPKKKYKAMVITTS